MNPLFQEQRSSRFPVKCVLKHLQCFRVLERNPRDFLVLSLIFDVHDTVVFVIHVFLKQKSALYSGGLFAHKKVA